MSFCSNCGNQLPLGAKFCNRCGAPVVSYTDRNRRNVEYEGTIHKCPNCGEIIKSFTAQCPSCGFEFRDVRATSAVKEFSYKLEQLENNRKPVSSFGKFKRSMGFGRSDPVDSQIVNLIKSFPIPNTKEDVLEFMILASSSVDYDILSRSRLYQQDMDPVEVRSRKDIANAWISKIKQVYEKASLSFGNDPDFREIQEAYIESCKISKSARRSSHLKTSSYYLLLVFALIFLFAYLAFLHGVAHPGDNSFYTAIVNIFGAFGKGIQSFILNLLKR